MPMLAITRTAAAEHPPSEDVRAMVVSGSMSGEERATSNVCAKLGSRRSSLAKIIPGVCTISSPNLVVSMASTKMR